MIFIRSRLLFRTVVMSTSHTLLSINDGVETTEGTMTASSVFEMRLRSLWSRSESETFCFKEFAVND